MRLLMQLVVDVAAGTVAQAVLEGALEEWLWRTLPVHPAWGVGRWSDGVKVVSVEIEPQIAIIATLYGLRSQQPHSLSLAVWPGPDGHPRFAASLHGYGEFRLE